VDVEGVSPWGEPARFRVVGVPRWSCLLFLSTTCLACTAFWGKLDDLPAFGLDGGDLVLGITRGPSREHVAQLRRLATIPDRVVMSDPAWEHYGVASAPSFLVVDGASACVASEGVAWSVEQIRAIIGALRTGGDAR
jgi:hypothetical protein